jgi:RimJ/RimL family protein N-acetyltransferase
MPEARNATVQEKAGDQRRTGPPQAAPAHMVSLHINEPAVALEVSLVPWDTESFSVPVAQVARLEVQDLARADPAIHRLLRWMEVNQVELAACRLEHGRLLESAALEQIGFRFIEMVYGVQTDPRRTLDAPEPAVDLEWRAACDADLPALQQIASSAFATGRWNMDWTVGPVRGGQRYADWVRRSLQDPSHEVLCALVERQVAGLFITERKADGATYWHLTAVAPKSQGKGMGKAMWTSMLRRHAAAGVTRVHTTIAARNLPVVNLYAGLGWRFVDCQMTYHWASARWLARGG